MIHDPIHYEHLVAYVDERRRALESSRVSDHPVRHGPGRLRRASAAALVRLAQRVEGQPVTTLPRGT